MICSPHPVGIAEHGLAILLQQRFAFARWRCYDHAGFQLPVKPARRRGNAGMAYASQDRLVLVTHRSEPMDLMCCGGTHGNDAAQLSAAGTAGSWRALAYAVGPQYSPRAAVAREAADSSHQGYQEFQSVNLFLFADRPSDSMKQAIAGVCSRVAEAP
jgi:hypothetical protein